jgi:pimeloyl-ACP methyl ester carboxylesterase
VVIRTAASSTMVGTVIALAGQSSGLQEACQLGPRCSLLVARGTGDEVIPSSCAESTFHLAGEPKELVLFAGAGHALDEVDADVGELVKARLKVRL